MSSGAAVECAGLWSSAVNDSTVPEWHYRVHNTFIEVRPEKGPTRQSSCPNLLLSQGAHDGTGPHGKNQPVSIKLDDHIEKTHPSQPFDLFSCVWPSLPDGLETRPSTLAVDTGLEDTDDEDDYAFDNADVLEPFRHSEAEPLAENDELDAAETIVTPRMSTLRCSQKDCDLTPPQPSKSEFVNIKLNKVDVPHQGGFCQDGEFCPALSEQITWDHSPSGWSFSALPGTFEGWRQHPFFNEFHSVDACGNPLPEASYAYYQEPPYQISLSDTLDNATSAYCSSGGHSPCTSASPKHGVRHHRATQQAKQRLPGRPVSILLRGLPNRITEHEVRALLDRASHLLGDVPRVRIMKDEHGDSVGAAEVLLPGQPDDVRIAKEVKKELHRTSYGGRCIDVVLPGVGHIAPLPK